MLMASGSKCKQSLQQVEGRLGSAGDDGRWWQTAAAAVPLVAAPLCPSSTMSERWQHRRHALAAPRPSAGSTERWRFPPATTPMSVEGRDKREKGRAWAALPRMAVAGTTVWGNDGGCLAGSMVNWRRSDLRLPASSPWKTSGEFGDKSEQRR